MANFVKIAVIAAPPMELDGKPADKAAVKNMISYWKQKADRVLPDEPDLILIPECSDRPGGLESENRMSYYEMRGEEVAEFWRETARANNCCVTYPAVRKVKEGFANATEVIGRSGETLGMYWKNYPTVGEIESGIIPGAEAAPIDCGFGKVICLICFDLNFEELRARCAAAKPDIILFSSNYHGGLMQNYWAYSCQAYFAGAIAPPGCRGSVISPVGELVAQTTNYYDFAVQKINLDCGVYHIDFNGEKFPRIKKKYGPDVQISDPGFLGAVLISCETEGLNIKELQDEFRLEPLEDYFERSIAARNSGIRENFGGRTGASNE